MSILRNRTYIIFQCDGCGDELATFENDFREAKKDLDHQDWVARKIDDQWLHACPECQENEIELAL